MFRPYARTDTRLLIERVEQVRTAPLRMVYAMTRALRVIRPVILEDVQVSPPQSSLPFIWSYDPAAQRRARAWYYANRVDPDSAGGRYARTGGLEEDWRVEGDYTPAGGVTTIANPNPQAKWVYGMAQVPSHARTGFIRIDAVERKYARVLGDLYVRTWRSVTTQARI
jgi:hypothetical protein